MLELSKNQLVKLNELEQREFVRRVLDDLVIRFSQFASEPALFERLQNAHEAAIAFGIHDGDHRVQFMHEEAWRPNFYKHDSIRAWFTKKGRHSPDQRWKDFQAVLNYWTRGEH